MDGVGENDPDRGGSQLLGVRGVFLFDMHVDFASPNSHFFVGGYRGISHVAKQHAIVRSPFGGEDVDYVTIVGGMIR